MDYHGNDYEVLLALSAEAPATYFQTPVNWPDPVILVSDQSTCPTYRGGFRASLFAEVWKDEEQRKYSRGLCHAHAVATCREHGGELMVMMQENQVVHVMSVHEVDGWMMLRDVFGDRVYPSREEIDQEEIDLISELHLLGTRVSHLLWIDADCTKLPCQHPTEEEIAEARQRLSVLRPLGEHGPKMANRKEALPSLNF